MIGSSTTTESDLFFSQVYKESHQWSKDMIISALLKVQFT